MNEREFKGVWIPKEVWLDSRLNALDKVILTEIDSLSGENGCYASNQYIAEFCQCSESKVSRAMSKLNNLGYIAYSSFDGRKRTVRSSLGFFARQPRQIAQADSANCLDSNIESNKAINTPPIVPRGDSIPQDDYNKTFDTFWQAYPREPKTGKANARKSWMKLKPDEALVRHILYAIEQQSDSDQWQEQGGKYIPMAATWLNQRRWEDTPPPPKPKVFKTVQNGEWNPMDAITGKLYSVEEVTE